MLEIKNLELKDSLEGILSKKIQEITTDDLNKIEFITLKSNNAVIGNEDEQGINLEDLLLFDNLKKCILKNYELSYKELKILEKINLRKLEILELYNCKIVLDSKYENSEKYILNLKSLRLSFCNDIDIGKVFEESNIQSIDFNNCHGINYFNLNKINKLDEIIFNEMKITKKIVLELYESRVRNINFNNCNINIFGRKKLKMLEKEKKINEYSKKVVI